MKKRWNVMVAFILVMMLVISACSGGGSKENNDQPTATPAQTSGGSNDGGGETVDPPADLSGTLEVWTFDDGGTKLLADAFTAKYPNVTINITNPGWNELPDNLQTTIDAGSGAPDVAYIEGGMFGRFVKSEGLEDLLQAPYNAGRYANDFSKGNWDRWLSLDGSKLLGMPWDIPPMVTFYRPDILENAGYSSDPADVAALLADPASVLELGQALKAQEIYLFENNKTPVDMVTSSIGYFDRQLNYLRNTDQLAEMFDLSKQVGQLGLAMNTCALWCDDGKALASTGKIAFLFYGPWAMGTIKDSLGQDQIGKWRVTSLPFNLNIGQGGSTMVIPSQGQNKELAWAFVEWSLASMEGNELWIKNGGSPGFVPSWDSPSYTDTRYDLLGDQPANVMFAEIMKKIETSIVPFPFNAAINDNIWGTRIDEGLNNNQDAKAVLQAIEDEIRAVHSVDLDTARADLGL